MLPAACIWSISAFIVCKFTGASISARACSTHACARLVTPPVWRGSFPLPGVVAQVATPPQCTSSASCFPLLLCRLSLGEAQLLAGRLEEAHALAEAALAQAREHQERGHEAYAL